MSCANKSKNSVTAGRLFTFKKTQRVCKNYKHAPKRPVYNFDTPSIK